MPTGLDLARVGEIGLRIAGLSPSEAHRFAQSVDWHGTLVVPVPADVSSFSEVSVHGHKGLLVETKHQRLSRESPDRLLFLHRSLMIDWSEQLEERYGRRGYPILLSLRLFDNLPGLLSSPEEVDDR